MAERNKKIWLGERVRIKINGFDTDLEPNIEHTVPSSVAKRLNEMIKNNVLKPYKPKDKTR